MLNHRVEDGAERKKKIDKRNDDLKMCLPHRKSLSQGIYTVISRCSQLKRKRKSKRNQREKRKRQRAEQKQRLPRGLYCAEEGEVMSCECGLCVGHGR